MYVLKIRIAQPNVKGIFAKRVNTLEEAEQYCTKYKVDKKDAWVEIR